jgi:hypothetical protein
MVHYLQLHRRIQVAVFEDTLEIPSFGSWAYPHAQLTSFRVEFVHGQAIEISQGQSDLGERIMLRRLHAHSCMYMWIDIPHQIHQEIRT